MPTVMRSELLRDGVVDRLDPEYFDPTRVGLEKKLQDLNGVRLGDQYHVSEDRVSDPRKDAAVDAVVGYVEIGDIDTRDGFALGKRVHAREAPSRARMELEEQMVGLSSVRPARSQVFVVTPDLADSIGSTGLILLKGRQDERISPRLLFVLLKTRWVVDQLDRRARASMYPTLHPPDIERVVLPSIGPEAGKAVEELIGSAQSQRASFLELSDRLRVTADRFFDPLEPLRLLEDLRVHRRTIRSLITLKEGAEVGRLDAEFHSGVFDDALERMRKGSDTARLGDLLTEDGAATGASPKADEFSEEDSDDAVAILKTGAMTGTGINWASVSFAPKELGEAAANWLVGGDVVFNSTAHQPKYMAHKIDVVTGIPPTVGNRLTFVSDLMRLRIADQDAMPPQFLAAFLRNPLGKEQIRRAIRGLSSHVYPEDICELLVPVPPAEVAAEIATLAEKVENARREYTRFVREAIDVAERHIEGTLGGVPV